MKTLAKAAAQRGAPRAVAAGQEHAPQTRREFLKPLHGVQNVLLVVADHAALVAWFWLGVRVLPLAAYIPVSLVVCLIHQRAMSEWVHEGAHLNLLPGRVWNDRMTNLLAGVWFALPVAAYRRVHFMHHDRDSFFGPDDPDTNFLTVASRRGLLRGVLYDLGGLTIASQFLRFRTEKTTEQGQLAVRSAAAGVHLVAAVMLWRVGRLDALLLYYVTLATLYPLLNRLRTYVQHVTVDERGCSRLAGSSASRTIDAGVLDRLIHTSRRLMYHHEHHRYPHLPYRALRLIYKPSGDFNCHARSRWGVLAAIYAGLPR